MERIGGVGVERNAAGAWSVSEVLGWRAAPWGRSLEGRERARDFADSVGDDGHQDRVGALNPGAMDLLRLQVFPGDVPVVMGDGALASIDFGGFCMTSVNRSSV